MLTRTPALTLRPLGEGRSARDRLQAALASALTRRAGVRVNDHVPNVPAIARRAVDQPPVEHQPSADTCRYDHAQHVAATAPSSPPVLARGHTYRVIVQAHLHAPESLGEPVAQREGSPRGNVQRRHPPRWPFPRRAAPAANSGPPPPTAPHSVEQCSHLSSRRPPPPCRRPRHRPPPRRFAAFAPTATSSER